MRALIHHTRAVHGQPPDPADRFAQLVERHDGVVARAQALELGWTPGRLRHHLRSRRRRRLMPGGYATFSGQVSERARLWERERTAVRPGVSYP